MIKAALSERRSLLRVRRCHCFSLSRLGLEGLEGFLVYSAGQPVKSAQKWNLFLSDMELLETAGGLWETLFGQC